MRACIPELSQGNAGDHLLDCSQISAPCSVEALILSLDLRANATLGLPYLPLQNGIVNCCFVSDPTYTENVFLTKTQNLSSHLGNFSLAACTEAYSQSDEQYACHLGCQNQLPFAELRQEQVSR